MRALSEGGGVGAVVEGGVEGGGVGDDVGDGWR